MDTYEVQVLDCYENKTYADGMTAAVYGQYPPLVNACRPPGEWQTYDIVFRRPHFAEDGSLIRPARMTVFHNGILVQDNDCFSRHCRARHCLVWHGIFATASKEPARYSEL